MELLNNLEFLAKDLNFGRRFLLQNMKMQENKGSTIKKLLKLKPHQFEQNLVRFLMPMNLYRICQKLKKKRLLKKLNVFKIKSTKNRPMLLTHSNRLSGLAHIRKKPTKLLQSLAQKLYSQTQISLNQNVFVNNFK